MGARYGLLTGLIGACVGLTAPVSPAAGENRAPRAPATETSSVAQALTLPMLLSKALRNNPGVRVEQAKIAEAQALHQWAKAQAYPRFSAHAILGGPVPEAKTTVLNDPRSATEASLEGDFRFGTLGVTLRAKAEGFLPLYTFDKIEKGKEATGHLVEAQKAKVRATQNDVLVQVKKAFWVHQLTRTFQGSLDEGESKLKKVLAKIEDLLEADSPQVTENDRLRLRHALSTLAVRRTEAQKATQISIDAMRLLIGYAGGTPLRLETQALEEHVPDKVPNLEELLQKASHQRPELEALRALVKAQQSLAGLRAAQFYPDLFLGGVIDYAYTSNATNQTSPFVYDPFNNFNAGVGVGLRIELDVFSKLALLEQAEAQTRVRARQRAFASAAVELEIRKLHTELSAGLQGIKALEAANRAARAWLTASTLAYDIGTGEVYELTDSFLAWAASEGELQKTRFDTIIQLVELARASGQLLLAKITEKGPKP